MVPKILELLKLDIQSGLKYCMVQNLNGQKAFWAVGVGSLLVGLGRRVTGVLIPLTVGA